LPFSASFLGFNKINLYLNSLRSKILFARTSTYVSPPSDEKLDSYYVTGFCDGESTFSVSVVKDSRQKTGWALKISFKIGLNPRDKILLVRLMAYFGVGKIYNEGVKSCRYSVQTTKELNVIINHFDKHPLITQKRADFELFKRVVELINGKKHLTHDGLQQIVNIRASMNNGLSDELKAVFPKTIPVLRSKVELKQIPNPF
jgi:hypothetical protein